MAFAPPPILSSPTSNRTFTFHPSELASVSSRAFAPFRLKITCQPFTWISVGRKRLLKAARRRSLRRIILNASAYHNNKDILAGADEQRAVPNGEWDTDRVLVVGEGVCIAASTAACLASVINRRSQESRLVASSTLESLVDARFQNFPLWQTLPLLGALLINAILRARQWQGKGRVWNVSEKFVGADLVLEERVRKLEEEVASTVTIIRVLSKQLEKLGVRFRVTRQTLRDPIQETALLAEKTSQAVNILAAREDDLEKGLEEIHQVLLGMQENQVKQLELISALGKLVRDRTGNRVDQPIRGAKKDNKRMASKQDGIEKDLPLQNSAAPPSVVLKSEEYQSTTEDPARIDQFFSGRKSIPTNLGSKLDEHVLHNDNGGWEGKSVHENISRPHAQEENVKSEKLLESGTGDGNFHKSPDN